MWQVIKTLGAVLAPKELLEKHHMEATAAEAAATALPPPFLQHLQYCCRFHYPRDCCNVS